MVNKDNFVGTTTNDLKNEITPTKITDVFLPHSNRSQQTEILGLCALSTHHILDIYCWWIRE